jgi:hypothetical protein
MDTQDDPQKDLQDELVPLPPEGIDFVTLGMFIIGKALSTCVADLLEISGCSTAAALRLTCIIKVKAEVRACSAYLE